MGRSAKRRTKGAKSLDFEASLQRALALVEVERPRLVRALRPSGLSQADRDDVVQVAVTEVALSWNASLSRLTIYQIYARVLRTAYLRARDAVRREKRRLRSEHLLGAIAPEAPIDPESEVLRERERNTYWQALHRLPRELREPLLLSVEGALTFEQIAAALGLPLGTVKTRIRRARALCRMPRLARPSCARTGLTGTAAQENREGCVFRNPKAFE